MQYIPTYETVDTMKQITTINPTNVRCKRLFQKKSAMLGELNSQMIAAVHMMQDLVTTVKYRKW